VGGDGAYAGSQDLSTLVGGSGGGGGGSNDISSTSSSGSGGGGGGAILIAANGTIRIDGRILATGSNGVGPRGGAGGPGAVRLVADAIEGSGSLQIGSGTNLGAARLEAFRIDAPVGFSPVAATQRVFAPGPISPPVSRSIAITAINGESVSLVNGQPISELPQGGFGEVDVVVDSFDPVGVSVSSRNVPADTIVRVTAKPRTGNAPLEMTDTLESCDASNVCTASVTFDLAPGDWFIEARATFQSVVP
jgi:hypothetical protein